MATQRGIESNPIQLRTVMESQPPTTRKGVQQLAGQLAALGLFISRFTDRLKPFFTTLKWAKCAGWDTECDQALIAIKQYLTEPPILASLETGETLYLYFIQGRRAPTAETRILRKKIHIQGRNSIYRSQEGGSSP